MLGMVGGATPNGASVAVITIGVVSPPRGLTVFAPEGHTPSLSVFTTTRLPSESARCSMRWTPFALLFGMIAPQAPEIPSRSEEHTSELQSLRHLVCRLLL